MTACNAQPPAGHPLHGSLVACHMAAGHDGPHTWETEPSPARRGLDRLLTVLPFREIEFVAGDAIDLAFLDNAHRNVDYVGPPLDNPWLVVQFVGGDRYAIWKATGAVHRVGPDGAVDDDPILTP